MKYIIIAMVALCTLVVGMALMDTTGADVAFQNYVGTNTTSTSSATQDALTLSVRVRTLTNRRLSVLDNSEIDWDAPILTGDDLAKRAVYVFENTKTVYFWGGIGYPFSEKSSMFNSMYKQYYISGTTENNYASDNYTSHVEKGYYCWDCVGLIRGLFCGWKDTGVLEPENNSNLTWVAKTGTPADTIKIVDKNADMLGEILLDLGTLPTNIEERDAYVDSNIKVGEVVWGPGRPSTNYVGHVGIYIGDGYVVESTGAVSKVIKSQLGKRHDNVSSPNLFFWTHHGKIPGIKYE